MITIVIHYRNRKEHLDAYLSKIQSYDIQIPYELVVVEQDEGKPFNRGLMKNIGFTLRNPESDYVIFNDVDIIPTEPMFQEYMKKTEVCRYLSPHHSCMGSVVGYHHKCFENTNGFPNVIFEWGVEDRILFYRTKHKDYDIKNENNTFGNRSVVKQFIRKQNNDSDPRTVSNWLKSYSDTQHKAFENRRQNDDFESLLQSDGLNTLPTFNIIDQQRNGNVRHVKVSI
tara:strand:- start:570 stop:1250 length:681 start_codon:yes stop_codon:yes gene_type:complete